MEAPYLVRSLNVGLCIEQHLDQACATVANRGQQWRVTRLLRVEATAQHKHTTAQHKHKHTTSTA